jgi:hypothetical protein
MTNASSGQIHGRILMIGPSRAGKSFLSAAFRQRGLPVVDVDAETDLIRWRSDATGQPVSMPQRASHQWFAAHHFLMDKPSLAEYLSSHPDILMFAHCWNIMDCLDFFDEVYLMYVPPEELERRMKLKRSDHTSHNTKAQQEFMNARHQERQAQARALGIPFIDVAQDAEAILSRLMELHASKIAFNAARSAS